MLIFSRCCGYLIREGGFYRKPEGEGKGSEDSTGFQQDASGYASAASNMGNLVFRYVAGGLYLLCSSIGSGLGPCPSTL